MEDTNEPVHETFPRVPSPLYHQILDGTPRLYHYTSQEGLLGMLQNKELWFTHISFMNDSSEYEYAVRLIEDILKEDFEIDVLGRLNNGLLEIPTAVYSFSLSENEDLLSQWRGYCPNGGYSLSFSEKQLKKLGVIGKCIYDREEQRQAIYRHIVGYTPEEFFEKPIGPRFYESFDSDRPNIIMTTGDNPPRIRDVGYYHWIQDLIKRAQSHAPFFKHESFKEEKEWRIIKTWQKPEFRAGKSFLVPYVRTQLDPNGLTDLKVIIGPSPHMSLAESACKMLLYASSNRDIEIVRSKIPFRNW